MNEFLRRSILYAIFFLGLKMIDILTSLFYPEADAVTRLTPMIALCLAFLKKE